MSKTTPSKSTPKSKDSAADDTVSRPVIAPIGRLVLEKEDVNNFDKYWNKDRTTKYPKRLIVCCDGTWQSSDKGIEGVLPSNVARISRLFANEGQGTIYLHDTGKSQTCTMPQIVYYQSGIGTGSITRLTKDLSGALGFGLKDNVATAYNFICNNYAVTDEIFLFGFSRGAYTARALAGLITECGIMRPGTLGDFPAMFQAYKKNRETDNPKAFKDDPWFKQNKDRLKLIRATNNIKFLGTWDTVGALGIPEWLVGKKNETYDVQLNEKIERAAHALSIDENRADFSPTLWYRKQDGNPPTTNLIQCWFPGWHADIGGGADDRNHIDDITLAWMIDQLGDLINFNKGEIELFIQEAKKHGWGQGALSPVEEKIWLREDRKPGSCKAPKGGKKDEFYETNEFIHPVTRYRMDMMKQKRKSIEPKSQPDSHNGKFMAFGPPVLDGKDHRYYWKRLTTYQKKPIVIPEYRIPPPGGKYVLLDGVGLERRIVPELIMADLDKDNGFPHVPLKKA